MSTTRAKYLKNLLLFNKEIPITTEKLKQSGISPFLARKYKDSGWLESIGTGAFKFPSAALTIEGLLHALQVDLGLPVFAGAKTALEMAGIRHFYRRHEKVYLYTNRKTNLPAWVKRYPWGKELMVKKTEKWINKDYMVNPGSKEFDWFIASKELAIVQLIELVNQGETFTETAEIFELMDSLNPATLNTLLPTASKKAKRIFLFLIEQYKHPWGKHIKRSLLQEKKSVITIEKAGKYLKNYNMVIPGDFSV